MSTDDNRPYIIATGSLHTGFRFIGPFVYGADAVQYAEDFLDGDEEPWIVTLLESP